MRSLLFVCLSVVRSVFLLPIEQNNSRTRLRDRVLLRSALAGALSISLVISNSAVGRSLTLLIQERSRKKVKWLP